MLFETLEAQILKHNAEKPFPDLDEAPLNHDAVLEKIQSDFRWKNIENRAKQFTELINCPIPLEADRDVFSYVNAIYHKSFQTTSNEREAKLLATIALLKENNLEQSQKLREQERILSCLAFRHILERLPFHRTKNEANNWTEFWEKAVKEANKPDGRVTPVTQIIRSHGIYEQGPDKPANITQIKNVGSALYNTLRTNIHHFTGEYKLGRDQCDVLPRKILEAIVPETTNDGIISWETERYRFISPPSDPELAAPSALVSSVTSSTTASARPVPPSTPIS